MKRTKYDAPAPRKSECYINKDKIWNKKKTVSEELTPYILNALRRGEDAETYADTARGTAEAVFNK